MQPDPSIRSNPAQARRFSIRLALFYSALFALGGTHLPFFPLWLNAIEVSPAWIGAIIAIPVVAKLVAVPLLTRGAERRGVLRGALVGFTFLTAGCFAFIGMLREPFSIFVLVALTACVWMPILPMTDGYALRGVALHRVSYGRIRLWGSTAFVVGALGVGLASRFLEPQYLIWVIVAAALVAALTSLLLDPIAQSQPHERAGSATIWRSPAFLSLIVAAALIQSSHAAYYTFSSITWQRGGFSGATISALWALGVLAEIVLFAVSPRLRWSAPVLIIAGGAGGLLRWTLFAQDPPLAWLAVLQLLHALTFGATHLGTMGLMMRLVPYHFSASAQGYLSASIGLTSAIASFACGAVYARLGEAIYYGMAAMAFTGALVMLWAWRNVHGRATT